jgi:hypothetical protein
MRPSLSQILVACAVLITLSAGFIGSIAGLDPMAKSVVENRAKAPHPDVSPLQFEKFTAQWDSYIADNFGFRQLLLKNYALFRHYVLHANSAENVFLEWLGVES